MLRARTVITLIATSRALAVRRREGFSFVFIFLVLLADDDLGGLDVLADSRPPRHGSVGFPGQPDYLDVFRPIVSGHGILVPGASDIVSLIDIEVEKTAVGNQHLRSAVGGGSNEPPVKGAEAISD